MKTAKPPQADSLPGPGSAPSSRRQPARQARSNPPRSSLLANSLGSREVHGHDQPIDIFPGVTHFTDAITSLPKDLVRHFTLLKEVDAKIFAPEDRLFQLVEEALRSTPPGPRSANDTASSIAPTSAPMSAQNSSTGIVANGSIASASLNDHNLNSAVYDPANIPRRQLFRETVFKIQEMLVSLEEKNHVISTANDALSKHLTRIDNVWPYLEGEFSGEAKWGSNTHWAYPENRISRTNATERTRRDGASAITAAAQALADEAAARTEARKQAVAAKKGLKNQHQDSDADAEHDKRSEPTKKSSNGAKSRKPVENNAPVGLGISSEATATPNPPPKKRKVDHSKDKTTTNGGQPMERAMSSVFGNNSTSKTKTSSPRATPAPEAGTSKKRKALPTVNGSQAKKSKNGLSAALSPSVASSPILPNFDPKSFNHAASAPAAAPVRPAASRARTNSTVSVLENARQRPSSSASNKPNGAVQPLPEAAVAQNIARAVPEAKPTKETPAAVKIENMVKENIPLPNIPVNAAQSSSRKNSVVKDDNEPKGEQAPALPTTTTTVVTTKSGRASKPSTPALGSFPEAVRPRSARNVQIGVAKRSHKKGASMQAALAAQAVADDDANSSAQGDDEGDVDANEPLYCYCNGVSYGEMVACDAEDCEKEWFHLGCVGLRSAPSSSTKWYCDNCKNRMKNGGKKSEWQVVITRRRSHILIIYQKDTRGVQESHGCHN